MINTDDLIAVLDADIAIARHAGHAKIEGVLVMARETIITLIKEQGESEVADLIERFLLVEVQSILRILVKEQGASEVAYSTLDYN